MSSDSVTRKPTSPSCYCTDHECSYTNSQSLQPLETSLSLNDSLRNNFDHEQIAPVFTERPSKSVSPPRQYVPETDRSYNPNVSRNNRDEPSMTSVPTQPPHPGITRFPLYSSGERESENSVEYKISPVPTQDQSSSNRTHNRRQQPQYLRETGFSYGARKRNEDLPPIPTQDISSSNGGPKLQYPQVTQGSYSAAKHQDFVEPLSIPSVPAGERNQSNYAQTRPQIQASSSTNKPQVRVEPPSISSVPIQDRSQSNYSRTHSQSQETQAPSNDNKPRGRAEQPTSIPTQDQGQDRSADASKTDTRPHLMHGTPSQMDTQYVNMLLALDDIPTLHNLYAGFFNWILLAGFILFPGTFTSLKNFGASGQVDQRLVHVITSIPLWVRATELYYVCVSWLGAGWRTCDCTVDSERSN